MIDTSKFIQQYEAYYFKEGYKKKDSLGIKGIKTTWKIDEEVIVDKLREGTHDQYAIAWKLGGFKRGERISPNMIRSSYRTYDMSEYINNVENNREEIEKAISNALDLIIDDGEQLDAVRELTKAFNIIRRCNTEKAFGTVYMINTMFFLSKGEIPIYDKNVFKAVQALYLDENPKDIIASDAPSASDSMGAMFRLIEYMYLLKKVFGADRKKQSKDYIDIEHVGYISRGLDRALWVYGQCTEKYK